MFNQKQKEKLKQYLQLSAVVATKKAKASTTFFAAATPGSVSAKLLELATLPTLQSS